MSRDVLLRHMNDYVGSRFQKARGVFIQIYLQTSKGCRYHTNLVLIQFCVCEHVRQAS